MLSSSQQLRLKSSGANLTVVVVTPHPIAIMGNKKRPNNKNRTAHLGIEQRFSAILSTVLAKTTTESILERAGPVISRTFLLELIAFRPIPVIGPASPARGVRPQTTGNDN